MVKVGGDLSHQQAARRCKSGSSWGLSLSPYSLTYCRLRVLWIGIELIAQFDSTNSEFPVAVSPDKMPAACFIQRVIVLGRCCRAWHFSPLSGLSIVEYLVNRLYPLFKLLPTQILQSPCKAEHHVGAASEGFDLVSCPLQGSNGPAEGLAPALIAAKVHRGTQAELPA